MWPGGRRGGGALAAPRARSCGELELLGRYHHARSHHARHQRAWSQRAEQLKTPQNACGAAVRELSSGAEPRACGLADDLGLGEALV